MDLLDRLDCDVSCHEYIHYVCFFVIKFSFEMIHTFPVNVDILLSYDVDMSTCSRFFKGSFESVWTPWAL